MFCPFRKTIETSEYIVGQPNKVVKEKFAQCQGKNCAAYNPIYNCALLRPNGGGK